jgi:pimeloyl-ACP methyl ester carboxylesterase
MSHKGARDRGADAVQRMFNPGPHISDRRRELNPLKLRAFDPRTAWKRARSMASIGIVQAGAARHRRPRPRGVLGLGLACLESAVTGRAEHRPTHEIYPEHVVRRVSFAAGGGLGWRISALTTPRRRIAPWKVVVVTGAPSWAEYWAPAMALLPPDREMIVVDRPGYGLSEPAECVGDIRLQAAALEPLLAPRPGQKILLVGQSYGAAIAALMASRNPRSVAALALLSSYLGESGPTARWLVEAGRRLKGLIPRDLRTAVAEVSGQAAQMPLMREALGVLSCPVHLIHGDADDFAPVELAQRLAAESGARGPVRFQAVAGAGHFLNDGSPEALIECLEACLPWAVSDTGIGVWIGRLKSRLPTPGRTTVPA